jgi:hypothetical protein
MSIIFAKETIGPSLSPDASQNRWFQHQKKPEAVEVRDGLFGKMMLLTSRFILTNKRTNFF